jgi:class 3 adenylate cyclase
MRGAGRAGASYTPRMIRCASCGQENPEGARFCNRCGSPVAAVSSAGEVRKTVTVLFADVVSSTSRSEQTDPESTRRMLGRYFAEIRQVVERHGGTVEKFIGDAAMAVFGIPTLHEDDALRAVRAAHDITVAIGSVNQELAGKGWQPITLRIGVNTGEVVSGDPSSSQTLVTGDAVNVAARLEQAANPGDVIVGSATHRLIRELVDVEPLPPLELKGKSEPVKAYRLLGLREAASDRRHDTPLVDRQRELRLLTDAFQRAIDEQACYLFTLLGSAGVGKSRLIHEFLGQVGDDARVLRARCLPYGEGITFWPIIELAQTAADIAPDDSPKVAMDKLRHLLESAADHQAIAERVAAAIGLSREPVPTEEIFWGVRKLFESLAAERPLVVVIDDLHWAEPTLLDLIDHIADWSREAPILLLAIARPELLDARPQWGGGKLNTTTIQLEPLGADDSTQLIGNLIHDEALARVVQGRIGETAEGNPLFVEELVAMLVDDGVLEPSNGGWRAVEDLGTVSVPPSISALVAARLDHLEPSERDLIGRASVVGKVFQRSAVTELSPPDRREDLGSRLMALVRKELVRPDRSAAAGDEAFRFRHILVRDAAYSALPKEQRADLHARFAEWLERIAGERLLEYEEVIAYHLEQAHRYRSELGLADELTDLLGSRAAQHLRATGHRALARDDPPAAINLLSRAAALLDDERERAEVLIDLGELETMRGNPQAGRARQLEAEEGAKRAGDELLRLRAEVERRYWDQVMDPTSDEEALIAAARQLNARGIEAGDAKSQASAQLALAHVHLNHCRWMENLSALELARSLVSRADDPRHWHLIRGMTVNALEYGPLPAQEAIERIEAMTLEDANSKSNEALLTSTAALLAMQGRFDEARERFDAGLAFFRERGMRMIVGSQALGSGMIADLAGDLEQAADAQAKGIAILQAMHETGVVSTLAAERALVLYRLGRLGEAETAIALAQETGAPNDIATQAGWRIPAAMIAADAGRQQEAETLIGEAVELVAPTDFLSLRGQVQEGLARVQARAGQIDKWREALDRAVHEHEQKGNLPWAQRVRDAIAAGPPQPAVRRSAPGLA